MKTFLVNHQNIAAGFVHGKPAQPALSAGFHPSEFPKAIALKADHSPSTGWSSSKSNSPLGLRRLTGGLTQQLLWPALALGLMTATALRAQTGALGTAFPLYATNFDGDEIIKVDANGNHTVFSSGGDLSNTADLGLALDAAGNLYVGSVNNNAIIKVDANGNQTVFSSGGNLNGPAGLAFDTAGHLYAASFNTNAIIKLDANGNQTVFSSGGNLLGPNGLVFDASGNLYVASAANGEIVKVDVNGNQTVFSSGGNLISLTGLAFDAAGNLYAAINSFPAGIIKMDTNGNQTVFSSGGDLIEPVGLAFDAAGNLYAGDALASDIVKMDTNGNQTVFSSAGNPFGIGFLAFTRLSYSFSGFLPPIANPPKVNSGVAGRAYPVKWQLKNSSTGAIVSTLSAITSITFESVDCSDFTGNPATSLPATPKGGSSLRYDTSANQYMFNWATPTQAGCYDLFLTLDSGQVFTAQFNLR